MVIGVAVNAVLVLAVGGFVLTVRAWAIGKVNRTPENMCVLIRLLDLVVAY